jgi:hypothetical protein
MPGMRSLTMLSLSVPLFVAGAALAQAPEVITTSAEHGPGVGIEQSLGGITGAGFSYDAARFHIDALLGYGHYNEEGDNDLSLLGVAGRFFFEVHEMPGADFSLGGGLGIVMTEIGDASDTAIEIEGVAQIRVWIVPNVAFSGSLGFAFLTADDGQIVGGAVGGVRAAESIYGIGGQLTGALGLFYYFR